MTAEIVNLRGARKTRQRVSRADAAAKNRVRFGQSRAEREIRKLAASRADRILDNHRLAGADSDDAGT